MEQQPASDLLVNGSEFLKTLLDIQLLNSDGNFISEPRSPWFSILLRSPRSIKTSIS